MEIGSDSFAAILPFQRRVSPIGKPIFLKRSRSPIKLGSTCSPWVNKARRTAMCRSHRSFSKSTDLCCWERDSRAPSRMHDHSDLEAFGDSCGPWNNPASRQLRAWQSASRSSNRKVAGRRNMRHR